MLKELEIIHKNLYLYSLIFQKMLISDKKNADVSSTQGLYHVINIIFWIFFRWSTTVLSFIILEFV